MDKKWWTLVAVCAGMFMLLLDVTIVIVAQPSIQAGLHAGFSDVQWTLDAYALTLASLLLTSGVARRPVRPQAAVHDRARDLHARLAAVRPRRQPADADRVAQRPGGRRRDDVRDVAGAARAQLPRPGARRRLRRVGRGHRHLHRARPGARRDDHDRVGLAGHLPGQRAGRRLRAGRDRLAGGGVPLAAPHAAGLGRASCCSPPGSSA